MIQNRFDEALAEAEEVDILIENVTDIETFKKEKPLLGVPITVKETIAVEGKSVLIYGIYFLQLKKVVLQMEVNSKTSYKCI